MNRHRPSILGPIAAIAAVGVLVAAALLMLPAQATPPDKVATTMIGIGRFTNIDATARPPRPSRPPRTPPSSGSWPESASPSPTEPRPRCPPPVPDEPSRPTGWLIASLAVLVAALALSGGLGVLTAKRTRRRARLEHAA